MKARLITSILVAFAINTTLCFAQGSDHPGKIPDDSAIVAAEKGRKTVYYVEGGNLVATKILPDDTSGSQHQKWQAKLSDGSMITVVYNSDMGVRVPIKVGDHFGVGGQYIQTGSTGLVHWVHDDPKHVRPDGYVYLNGIVYGDVDHEDN